MELLTIIKNRSSSNNGQVLIELLLAIGLAAIILPSILTSLVASRDGRDQQEQRLEATAYLKEAEEAVRVVKENWNNIPANGTYHPEISANTWTLVPGAESIKEFTRQIDIENVYRDINGTLSLNSTDTLDPSTKRIITTVSWQTPYPSSAQSSTYITRHLNAAFIHTTETTYNAGITTNTTVRATSGSSLPDDGEVLLGAGGSGNWCGPELIIAGTDLPRNGIANAVSAIEGRIFAGTGINAAGVSYADVIVDNNNPPGTTLGRTFDGFKTNDVFGENDYAYIATDTNNKEIVIIDLNSPNPSDPTKYIEAGYFNAPGNGDGDSIFVSGNIGYMTSGSTFYTFDLSSKNGSRGALDSATLVGTGVSMVVIGDYAYIAVDSNTSQLQIINISDPNNLSTPSSTTLNGLGATDIFVDDSGNTSYITTRESPSLDELFSIDTTLKTSGRPTIGSKDSLGMDPKGVVVVPGNIAIIVGSGAEEYQVIDTISMTRCGGLEIDTGINEIATVLESDGDAYSYIITGDASSELKIIEGGPGGTFSISGSFESPIFDASSNVVFNYFSSNVIQPSLTTITLQVAVADALDCNSANYLFVGPDGTVNTVFTVNGSTVSGIIPYVSSGSYQNPGRCFKYKVNFSSSSPLSSPVLSDITINHSL